MTSNESKITKVTKINTSYFIKHYFPKVYPTSTSLAHNYNYNEFNKSSITLIINKIT